MNTKVLAASVAAVVLGGLGAASLAGGSTRSAAAPPATPWAATECGTYSGTGCSPAEKRVDLDRPKFSNPTAITNPLFPIADLRSAVLLGKVDGEQFRSETTLLPETVTVDWAGQRIEVLVSQYTAYRDGRIEEVAIDRYAQSDDGAVWYLGEDVVDYRDGVIFTTAGTWLAGREGPAAMIMPAHPMVGDVFRPENILGVVFEEVRVTDVGKTVPGTGGPIQGAVVAEELHLDGTHSEKVFAPGRGEYSTGTGGDTEILAIGMPADAATGPEPAQLGDLLAALLGYVGAAEGEDWEAATSIATRIERLTRSLPRAGQPGLVLDRLDGDVRTLARLARSKDIAGSSTAAILAGQSVVDLQLRYRPAAVVDRARFELWCYRVLVDAAAGDRAGVRGDVATLEWMRDRFAATLSDGDRAQLDARIAALRGAAAEPGGSVGDHAIRLADFLRRVSPT
ncbi:MAG: hypothetical protein U0R50_08570 [Gaiellales bacterium]